MSRRALVMTGLYALAAVMAVIALRSAWTWLSLTGERSECGSALIHALAAQECARVATASDGCAIAAVCGTLLAIAAFMAARRQGEGKEKQ